MQIGSAKKNPQNPRPVPFPGTEAIRARLNSGMQVNYGTFHNWAPLAGLGNVFGSTTTGRHVFNGNPHGNLRAAARILNSYGGGRTAAGHYRTGTGDFSRTPYGTAAFAARVGQYDRWVGGFDAFFNCLTGR